MNSREKNDKVSDPIKIKHMYVVKKYVKMWQANNI